MLFYNNKVINSSGGKSTSYTWEYRPKWLTPQYILIKFEDFKAKDKNIQKNWLSSVKGYQHMTI